MCHHIISCLQEVSLRNKVKERKFSEPGNTKNILNNEFWLCSDSRSCAITSTYMNINDKQVLSWLWKWQGGENNCEKKKTTKTNQLEVVIAVYSKCRSFAFSLCVPSLSYSCKLSHFWFSRGAKDGLINRQSQNNVKIEADKQRAFGGWRSCFVRCNIIWTWLVLLPPVGLASFCWHFAVICTLQSGPFSPHQKCFYARVSGCLWCLPSAPVREREQGPCSGAEGGRLLCALSVFSEGENWLKGCQCTPQTHINTQRKHAHTATSSVFALSCTPSKK